MLTRSIIHILVPVTATTIVISTGYHFSWRYITVYSLLGDPRKMFTDSSFYSAKHHPTVADQVEMAHKLSSAMFNEKNK